LRAKSPQISHIQADVGKSIKYIFPFCATGYAVEKGTFDSILYMKCFIQAVKFQWPTQRLLWPPNSPLFSCGSKGAICTTLRTTALEDGAYSSGRHVEGRTIYNMGTNRGDGERQTRDQCNYPRIRPSGKSACHRHGDGTHRLDPTQSDGCILQAAGTAATVKVLQHRQTADFKRHVWEMTQIILYQGQSVNLSPLRLLIEREAQPLFIFKFGLLDEGAIIVLHSNAHTLTQNLITFLRHMLSDKKLLFWTTRMNTTK
jgi:hypothetical protein